LGWNYLWLELGILHHIYDNRRGEGMGWYSSATTIAMALGPVMGIWVTDSYSYNTLCLFAILLSIAALIFACSVKTPYQNKTKQEIRKLNLNSGLFFLVLAASLALSRPLSGK